jgi:hypothetical protein
MDKCSSTHGKMLVIILVFSWYFSNYDLTFKIINRLKINNDNLIFHNNFKNHITIKRITV